MNYLFDDEILDAKAIIDLINTRKLSIKELAYRLKDMTYNDLTVLRCDALVDREYYAAAIITKATREIIVSYAQKINKMVLFSDFMNMQITDDYEMLIQIRIYMYENIRDYYEKSLIFIDNEIQTKRELVRKQNLD